jgi:hypothetical protein
MASVLDSYNSYAQFVYSLLADRATIESHTLAVYTTSRAVGIMRGQVVFNSGHVLRAFEQIDFVARRIVQYFYEVRHHGEPAWWYDPMPHPDVPELQSTHPHHKHVQPDIKHHRIPATGLSFSEPNLPYLIGEIEALASETGISASS